MAKKKEEIKKEVEEVKEIKTAILYFGGLAVKVSVDVLNKKVEAEIVEE